eukprot:evm.model.NODE_46481_length_9140_cov_25.090481.1
MRCLFAFTTLVAATSHFSLFTAADTPAKDKQLLGGEDLSWYNGNKQYKPLAGEELAWYLGDKQYMGDKTLISDYRDHHDVPKDSTDEYYHEPKHASKYDNEENYYKPKHASKYDADEYYHEPKHASKYNNEENYYKPMPVSKGKGKGNTGKGKGGWMQKGQPKKNLRKGDYNKL